MNQAMFNFDEMWPPVDRIIATRAEFGDRP